MSLAQEYLCEICQRKFNNWRSIANHKRWHNPQWVNSHLDRLKTIGLNCNEKNGNWRGDNIKCMSALHSWIRNHKPKPEFCEYCEKNKPFDLANISGKYKRNINDYEWLCRKCHMQSDGRLNKLVERNRNRRNL